MTRPITRSTIGLMAAISGLWATSARANDIFTRRPARVAPAAAGQSLSDPIAFRMFDFGAVVPETPDRNGFVAGSDDPLSLWVPTYEGGTSTETFSYFAEELPVVNQAGGTVTFDLYRRMNGLTGDAITGPQEFGYWIGTLTPGEYQVDFTLSELPPLPDAPRPVDPPWQDGIPQASLIDQTSWTFRVVPEPASSVLIGMATMAGVATRRASRSQRR